jgi:hypothetical protein
VGGKIFTVLSLDVGSETRLSLKCTPERFRELIELEGVRPAPYVGRFIRASYGMVAAKTKNIHRPNATAHRAKPT